MIYIGKGILNIVPQSTSLCFELTVVESQVELNQT